MPIEYKVREDARASVPETPPRPIFRAALPAIGVVSAFLAVAGVNYLTDDGRAAKGIISL